MKMSLLGKKHAAVDSGLIRLRGTFVDYSAPSGQSFTVPLDQVAVIGEFTTDAGPLIDDWFLAFVWKDGEGWFQASMYAEGRDQFLSDLSAVLGVAIETGLAGFTDFESRVLWPQIIAGRPFFTFTHVVGTSALDRLKLAIFPRVAVGLSSEVMLAVRQRP